MGCGKCSQGEEEEEEEICWWDEAFVPHLEKILKNLLPLPFHFGDDDGGDVMLSTKKRMNERRRRRKDSEHFLQRLAGGLESKCDQIGAWRIHNLHQKHRNLVTVSSADYEVELGRNGP